MLLMHAKWSWLLLTAVVLASAKVNTNTVAKRWLEGFLGDSKTESNSKRSLLGGLFGDKNSGLSHVSESDAINSDGKNLLGGLFGLHSASGDEKSLLENLSSGTKSNSGNSPLDLLGDKGSGKNIISSLFGGTGGEGGSLGNSLNGEKSLLGNLLGGDKLLGNLLGGVKGRLDDFFGGEKDLLGSGLNGEKSRLSGLLGQGLLGGVTRLLGGENGLLDGLLGGEKSILSGLLDGGQLGGVRGLVGGKTGLLGSLLSGEGGGLVSSLRSVFDGVLKDIACVVAELSKTSSRLTQRLADSLKGVNVADSKALKKAFATLPLNQVCGVCHTLKDPTAAMGCRDYCTSGPCRWQF